jgi:hypothetical protein
MAEFRLTDRGRADLIDIYDFTETKFGAYQADAHYSGLVRSFGLLADFFASASRSANWRRVIGVSAFNPISSSTRSSLIMSKSVPSFTTSKTSDRNFLIS